MLSGVYPPHLIVYRLYPEDKPYTAFFVEGEPTRPIGFGLLRCVVFHSRGSFIEIFNVHTGVVFGRRGPYDNRPLVGRGAGTTAHWDHDRLPVLKANHTGLYGCRSSDGTSPDTYQLNVRGKFTPSGYFSCFCFLYPFFTKTAISRFKCTMSIKDDAVLTSML